MMGTNVLISLISALEETFHLCCCFFLTVVAILTASFFLLNLTAVGFFLWVDYVILLVVLTVTNNIIPNAHDYIYIVCININGIKIEKDHK